MVILAPVFLLFEIWQLVISERYLGLKQIARGADPRSLGMSEGTAFAWSAALFAYWFWMASLLLAAGSRIHGVALLAITALGYAARRGVALKWVLVVLTLEGAVRFGLLFSLCWMLWRRR